jgi:hypothetical protein
VLRLISRPARPAIGERSVEGAGFACWTHRLVRGTGVWRRCSLDVFAVYAPSHLACAHAHVYVEIVVLCCVCLHSRAARTRGCGGCCVLCAVCVRVCVHVCMRLCVSVRRDFLRVCMWLACLLVVLVRLR